MTPKQKIELEPQHEKASIVNFEVLDQYFHPQLILTLKKSDGALMHFLEKKIHLFELEKSSNTLFEQLVTMKPFAHHYVAAN